MDPGESKGRGIMQKVTWGSGRLMEVANGWEVARVDQGIDTYNLNATGNVWETTREET